jgi:mannose-1-phosphate guanylyltransferase
MGDEVTVLHAIVMAGGAGTRFWPVSRRDRPKQLQPLYGNTSLLRQTVDRLDGLVPPERILVVTNRKLVEASVRELPHLPPQSIIGEPAKRDTAPCIGLAALLVLRDDPDATMLVMPSDHVIAPANRFRDAVEQAAQLVADSPERLVTFGIKPTYPAESFGYIHRGEAIASSGAPAYRVKEFREKPNASTAATYVASGEYYWNGGIFVWKAQTILDELGKRHAATIGRLRTIAAAWDSAQRDALFEREFTAIQGTSIDYAVMEHAQDVAVIEAPFEWDDVGSWQSLARLGGSDNNGNAVIGRHLGIDTRDSIVRSDEDHLVVTLGVEGLIVVHTPGATLVANRQDEERIREVVKEIEARKWEDVL